MCALLCHSALMGLGRKPVETGSVGKENEWKVSQTVALRRPVRLVPVSI